MSFTGSDIKLLVEGYINTTLTETDCINFINQGLNRIAALGLAFDEMELSSVLKDTWETLPTETIGVVFVMNENDNIYYLWQYRNDNKIRFAENGDYTVIIKKIPSDISVIGDTVDLHDVYKTALFNYVSGMAKLRDNDNSGDGIRMLQEFERLATNAFNTLITARKPAQARA